MTTTPVPPARPAPRPQPGKFRSFLAYVFLPHANPGEIIIVSHSNLFYWWPVWFTGFILTLLTYFNNHYMAVVPAGTRAVRAEKGTLQPPEGPVVELKDQDVLVVPENKNLPVRVEEDGTKKVIQPHFYMSPTKNYGVIFAIVLLVVIFITNVPLRGLWSLIVIMIIVFLAVIFAVAGVWERLLHRASLLAIHINMGGYLFLSVALFIIWAVNLWFFDRQFYMVFTPGQVRVHLEIGAGETVYDTNGMVFQKQRSDLFRHWILGFGSGDLIVRPGGGNLHIDLPNVLGVSRKVRQIERKLAEKEVVPG